MVYHYCCVMNALPLLLPFVIADFISRCFWLPNFPLAIRDWLFHLIWFINRVSADLPRYLPRSLLLKAILECHDAVRVLLLTSCHWSLILAKNLCVSRLSAMKLLIRFLIISSPEGISLSIGCQSSISGQFDIYFWPLQAFSAFFGHNLFRPCFLRVFPTSVRVYSTGKCISYSTAVDGNQIVTK